MNLLTMVGKLEASTFCLRESTRRVLLSGNQAAVDRVRRVAVEEACAQSGGQAKKAPISS